MGSGANVSWLQNAGSRRSGKKVETRPSSSLQAFSVRRYRYWISTCQDALDLTVRRRRRRSNRSQPTGRGAGPLENLLRAWTRDPHSFGESAMP